MLRAERRDTISIESTEQRFVDRSVPESFTVVERTETYFGPELLLSTEERNFLLTAPGPDSQLLLWGEIVSDQNYREEWYRLAEVRATLDDADGYDLCSQCGYPIRTEEHERLAAIGRCPEG